MPNRKPSDGQARDDHGAHSTVTPAKGDSQTSADDHPVPDGSTVSVPGGFKNDPDDPQHPDEAIEKFRRKNLKP